METILAKTYTAGADLSNYQYCFVYMSGANTVTYTGSGGSPIGILQNAPESGEDAVVMHIGVSLLSMSAAVSVNALVGSAANGQGVAVTSDDAIYAAYCLQASTQADDEVRVLLPGGYHTISGAGDD
jgi:hypothetical protein